MTDLRERFDLYRQMEAPDLWEHIEDLAAGDTLQPLPAPRRRPAAVAVAAFVSVLAVGLGFLIFRSDGGPAPIGAQAPEPTTTTMPTVDQPDGPISSPNDLIAGWQQVTRSRFNDLVAFGDRLIAVGGGPANAAGIWTSGKGCTGRCSDRPICPTVR
jgi:hypothetical protein